MSADSAEAGGPRLFRRSAWWRFPSMWIVASPASEDLFSKIVWLILPLQYYVLSKFPTGLRGEYVAVALVTVVSIASLFGVGLLFALPYYRTSVRGAQSLRDVEDRFGSRYALAVRIWAIALIVSWMSVYVVLAVSYAIGGEDGDLLGQLVCSLRPMDECNGAGPKLRPLYFFEYFAYSLIAVLLVMSIAAIHRKLKGAEDEPSPLAEPNPVYVVATIAILLTLINSSTVT